MMLQVALHVITSITICFCSVQKFKFQSNTPCVEDIELSLDGEIETTAKSAIVCALLCTEMAGCGGFLYYLGTKTCYGVNSDSPMFQACALPGAHFYKDPDLLTTTPPPTTVVTTTSLLTTTTPPPLQLTTTETTTPPPQPITTTPRCENELVAGLPDAQLTASSSADPTSAGPERAKMQKSGSWEPNRYRRTEYLQVDFMKVATVVAIVTRGDVAMDSYVRGFKVLISNDCSVFEKLTDADGNVKDFHGNTDAVGTVTNDVTPAVHARCLRIQPDAWTNGVRLKIEILGC